MITLKNEVLEVTLANKGAEIIKIVGQDDQINICGVVIQFNGRIVLQSYFLL